VRKVIWGLLIAALIGCVIFVQARAGKREMHASKEYPPIGQFVTVDDVPVHVFVAGEGPDLVLIHGASGNMRDFTFDFVDRLTRDYRVIVFDRPGLGWTNRTNPKYASAINRGAESPAEQAALLQAAATELGAEKPLVLGHSYGGAVALAWAVHHPDNISGLITLGGVSNPWPGGLGALYKINSSSIGGALAVPLITAFVSEDRIKSTIEEIFAPQAAPDGYADYVGAALSTRRRALRANARQVNSLRPHVVELSKRHHEITVPTEILHGDADTIVPLAIHSQPLSQQIPNANLIVMDGVGHMPQHADPATVIDAIHRAATRAGLR
jgi:pimeloyl-ACP methyl ester carboxylesterase